MQTLAGLLEQVVKYYKTTDGGCNYKPFKCRCNIVQSIVFNMLDANNGFLCAAGGIVRRTTDGGVSWDTVDVGNTSPRSLRY